MLSRVLKVSLHGFKMSLFFDTSNFLSPNSCACRRMMSKIVRNARLNSTFRHRKITHVWSY